MHKELGYLTQGFEDTKVINICVPLIIGKIHNISQDRTIIYGQIVVHYHLQKADPYYVQITIRENLIEYLGITTTNATDMITSKLI